MPPTSPRWRVAAPPALAPPSPHGKGAAELLPLPVSIPEKHRKHFPSTGLPLLYLFTGVSQIVSHKSRPLKRGRPKKKKVLVASARRVWLCCEGIQEDDWSITDIRALLSVGKRDLAFLLPKRTYPDDFLLRLKNPSARDQVISTILRLHAAALPLGPVLKTLQLVEHAKPSDAVRLEGNDVPADFEARATIPVAQPRNTLARQDSDSSSSSDLGPPSDSPPDSPVRKHSRSRSRSRSFSEYRYEESDASGDGQGPKDLERQVSELRGEISGLYRSIDHLSRRFEGSLEMAVNRVAVQARLDSNDWLLHQYETERSLDLTTQIRTLSAQVAALKSENAALAKQCMMHGVSPRLPTSTMSWAPVDPVSPSPRRASFPGSTATQQKSRAQLEEEFDRELEREASRK